MLPQSIEPSVEYSYTDEEGNTVIISKDPAE